MENIPRPHADSEYCAFNNISRIVRTIAQGWRSPARERITAAHFLRRRTPKQHLMKRVSLLEFQEVTKDYISDGQPVRALNCVTLAVEEGEFVALVGRSGCGKSTLLNLAGAMDLPTAGEVRIDGIATATLDDAGLTRMRREKIGFVFQSFQLLHTLTAVENVELPLQLAGRSGVRELALQGLTEVGLDGLAHRFPHQLSGGQMQRVAIARALVHSPRVLLADEPTGNLDTATGNAVLELLRTVARDRTTTILMATHSAESISFADIAVRLRDGHIEEVVRR